MKTIQKRKRLVAIVAVALSLLMNVPVKAQEGMEVYLLPYKGKRALLKISHFAGDQSLSVKIKGQKGDILYSEQLKKSEDFNKVFDFAFVEEGVYTFDVINGGNLIRSIVTVSEDKLTAENFGSDLSKAYAFKKQIQEADEKLMVKFENHLHEPLTLKIYDSEKGALLHEEENIEGESFAKLYDLSKLDKGLYSMSITGETYSYYYYVDLRR